MAAVKFLSFRDSALGKIFSSCCYEVSGKVMFRGNHIIHISKLSLTIPLYNTYIRYCFVEIK
jgi:hypothetical protein